MKPLIQAIASIKPREKPPQVTTQTIACPIGQIGTGDHQERAVTGFDYGLPFTWNYGPWVSVNNDCQDPIYTFVTPLQDFDPAFGGSAMIPGLEQTLGPVTTFSGPYTMTLTYHVYIDGVEPALERISDLTITLSPVPAGTLSVAWDRDYASFADQPVDPSGTTSWLAIPNSEWTDNASSFTVTLTVSV